MRLLTEDKQMLLIKKDNEVIGSIGALEVGDTEAKCGRAVFNLSVANPKSKGAIWELAKIDEGKETTLGNYQVSSLNKLKIIGEYAMIERLIMKQV